MLLTVVQATPTPNAKNPGFIVKLQSKEDKSVATAFGTKTSSQQTTYYIKLDSAPEVGFTADMDLTPFRVEERPTTITDNDAQSTTFGEEIIIQCKWLHVK